MATPRKQPPHNSEATPGASAPPRKRRPVVPAAQAQQLLIETAIELLRARPFDQVTARLITREAGLDLSTISRNFGSMQNLFVTVCRQLAASAVARRQQVLGAANPAAAYGLMLDPDLLLRNRVIAWMVGEGARGAVDEERQRETMTWLAEEFRAHTPVSERTAWLWMHMMVLLSEGLAVFGDLHYLSEADRMDAFQMVLALRAQLPTVEQSINWVG